LQNLINIHYHKAKVWTGWLVAAEILIYMAGVVAVFLPNVPLEYPAVALVIVLITTRISIKAEKFKWVAESLKRQFEYCEGFGQPPSRGQLADLRASVDCTLSDKFDALLKEGLNYSSEQPLGHRRSLENLCESAWFSKHLAGWCSEKLRALFVVCIIGAVVILLIVASSAPVGNHVATLIAKCVSSTLTFLVSIGILRSWLAYADFSKEAGSLETEAQRLLEDKSAGAFEAQRLLAEYQLLRATSPSIPTWVWKIRRKTLNQNWAELKRPTK